MLQQDELPEVDAPRHAGERRTARSSDPLVALSRCFESARRRAGLHALVLADVSGLTIAGAGPASLCDEVAARGAVASVRPANDTVPCRIEVLARTLEVRRLQIDGIEVLLCTESAKPSGVQSRDPQTRAGDPSVDATLERGKAGVVDEAVAGCERILGRRRPST